MKKQFNTGVEMFLSATEAQEQTQAKETTANESKRNTEPNIASEGQTQTPVKEKFKVPEGYKLVKEPRSERVQLLITPTTRKALEKKAKKAGQSLNTFVNGIIEKYLEEGSLKK